MGLLGIDVGTSGCKATVVALDGEIKAQAYREYSLHSPRPGWYELDSEHVWECVKGVIAAAMKGYSGEPVRALSVSSFGEAVTAVSRTGKVLHNGIAYIDPRGADEVKALADRLGAWEIASVCGVTPHPMYSLGKIMWLKENMPDVYRDAYRFLPYSSYILYRLGAKPHMDYSLAARTMALDIAGKRWSPMVLDGAGVDEEKLGELVPSGAIVGEVRADLADELGLPRSVLLAAGGHDQPCAALGAGVIDPGSAVDGLGTTECITPVFTEPVINKQTISCGFACVPHVIPDRYVTYAFTFTCGSILKWYRDNFGLEFRQLAESEGGSAYTHMIEHAVRTPSKLFVLPHFAGAATPYMDMDARGAIVGLDINTGSAEVIKAVLEGITFEMMVNVESLGIAGIAVDELRAVGGLARSERYLQLKADIMGKKVITLAEPEAGTLGVAMLAGLACGAYGSVHQAVRRLVKPQKEYCPDDGLHRFYLNRFQQYKKLYPLVAQIPKWR
jgi:xylulokinase